ncbi:DNA ligase [Acidithiobacillus ferrivorans]|uniref:DNA ligase n=1 Tax=Acidithiobacillus ferrivorans TaxID=160808 RepID=A0A060UV79_9PROT|nr:BRCT domain-containing protein [Acidithiobacillus ferrivorans]CDQ10688.1 DNA ligase [Acidithiobacillus ferrivorans]SMH64715.1 DNA ligase [Acidithiobacillus ferrivorans]
MELVKTLTNANDAYRAGTPVMSDAEYDALVEELRATDPDHPFLHQVEPEPESLFQGSKVRHLTPMLSTDKAYAISELAAFFKRVLDVATSIGIGKVLFRATPKLDGLSGRYDGQGHLSTRGNGLEGQDISNALQKGLCLDNPDLTADGEIVIDQPFFEENLQGRIFNGRALTHPRNFMVGFIGADDLGEHHRLAVEAKAARFVPYVALGDVQAEADIMLDDIEGISRRLRDNCQYLTDGIVIEAMDPRIREAMGATNHHHRWQIAFKTKGETAETMVRSITWQVGRTGRVTPVLEIEPVELSGATIRRVTAHTAAIVQAKGIGVGAVIKIIRSGEVIPKVETVLQPADVVEVPTQCPCCNIALEVDGEYLLCPGGIECMSQSLGILEHFCQMLEIDGAGPSIISNLVHGGVETFSQVFDLTTNDLENMGISSGVAKNLSVAIQARKNQHIDDWRVLAAFGIRHLGRGDAKKLLAKTRIGGLNFVTEEFLSAIDGFGPITSPSIAADIQRLLPEINAVVSHLTIRHSMDAAPSTSSLPLKGKRIVFTGTFATADRKVLEKQAETLGAQVQSGVNAKTDFLIMGDKPGSKKVSAAQALPVTVLDEARYVNLIRQ